LRLIRISNNLGDARSHHHPQLPRISGSPPRHAPRGIGDGLVRLSCGLEHPDDIVEDVFTALAAV
jgi:O-succinylhomoserine sulfhydrylase